jgi:hypothetical protein
MAVRRLLQRAIVLIRQMRLIEARDTLDDLLQSNAHDPDALACRGWIHAIHGCDDLARADLEAALRYAQPGWPRRAEVESQLGLDSAVAVSRA